MRPRNGSGRTNVRPRRRHRVEPRDDADLLLGFHGGGTSIGPDEQFHQQRSVHREVDVETARQMPRLSVTLGHAFGSAGRPMLFALRLWASVCLALYVAFWLQLDNAYWAGTTAALVCQPHLGASLRKGWFRMIGTMVGAIVVVLLTACFPQDRLLFLTGLALWGGLCAGAATILHNFAAYSAALAGYTAAIIAGDELGAIGGLNGDAFTLAITRVSEISIGIASAGVVLAGTDLGGGRRQLATLLTALTGGITAQFAATLVSDSNFSGNRLVRRAFLQRVIALDAVIDETLGEAPQIRYHSPVLQKAVDGLFAALSEWRAVAIHLSLLSASQAQAETSPILERVPLELTSPANQARWTTDPIHMHRICESTARRLMAFQATTPLGRLLFDKTAETLIGVSQALNGLALLVADPARDVPRGPGFVQFRVPDWLPALVNAGRAFVTIGTVALFWIVTGWPNGAGAIVWASISVILLSPRAERASSAALVFAVGNTFATGFAAILTFAVLPQLETFVGFSIALGAYLVLFGALMAQPWQMAVFVPMVANIVPLIAPANQMVYDTAEFYNAALALLGGSAVGVLAFRLLPPLSPAMRTCRLLGLTLQELRRLASGRKYDDWSGRVHGRLCVMPVEAKPSQRALLLASLSVGVEIMRLRESSRGLGPEANVEPAFAALARGQSSVAISHLARADSVLADRCKIVPDEQITLRVRASILALSEVVTQLATWLDTGGHE
jgi:uncharacterized membrane protein YccC